MTAPLLIVRVLGEPITQGSKTATRYGMRDSNAKKLKPWRDKVTAAALDTAREFWPLTGPARVEITFTLARPAAAKNRAAPFKRGSGDVDKLTRAILDSCTDAGLWLDDSQVVEVLARKVYPDTHPLALGEPGAVIHIWSEE